MAVLLDAFHAGPARCPPRSQHVPRPPSPPFSSSSTTRSPSLALSTLACRPPTFSVLPRREAWQRVGQKLGARQPLLRQKRHPPVHRSKTPVALFTGIVEEMGRVLRLEQEQGQDGKLGWTLEVQAQDTFKGTQLGESVAVNGTCLTVTTLNPLTSSFTFGVSPETLRCTSLGELQPGVSSVNLERSLRPDGRLGGHFVQGHVDATGTIVAFWEEGDSLWVRINAPKDLLPYIVPKGYIAVDGTSLTVVDVNDEDSTFTFMLVAYTQQKIVIPSKTVGSKVNLEVDILGKYVARMFSSVKGAAGKCDGPVPVLPL